jgi:hypothetical protein
MSLTESELLAKVPTQLYIAGQWVDGHGAQSIEVEVLQFGKIVNFYTERIRYTKPKLPYHYQ